MTDFKTGDKVRFKGDPDKETYTVVCVNGVENDYGSYSDGLRGTLELEAVKAAETTLDWIPTRLVEVVEPTFEKGDVIMDDDDGIFIFFNEERVYEEVYSYVQEDRYGWHPMHDLTKPIRKIGHVDAKVRLRVTKKSPLPPKRLGASFCLDYRSRSAGGRAG